MKQIKIKIKDGKFEIKFKDTKTKKPSNKEFEKIDIFRKKKANKPNKQKDTGF